MEDANMICNKNMLPWDESAVKPSGLRFGSQEMTRIGMKESDMKEVASFIARICKGDDTKKVKSDVREFRKGFKSVKYCFNDNEPAYGYRKLVP